MVVLSFGCLEQIALPPQFPFDHEPE
jgi:hypothetical protein